jgi:dolichyl-phosphate-mannose-protein mannosyltransferase
VGPETFRRALGLLAIVMLIGAGTRFVALWHPREVYFDETYYANDAVVYLEGAGAFRDNLDPYFGGTSRASEIVPVGAVPGEISWVHPPLGKWGIALGILVFGKQPFGWRVVPAIFGTASVGLVFVMGWLIWRRRSWAFLAALLVAVDGLEITMSRVAMLDIFAATFILASFVFLLYQRRRLESDRREALAEESGDDVEFGSELYTELFEYETEGGTEEARPEIDVESIEIADSGKRAFSSGMRWLVAAGVFMGLALASKLSALYAWGLLVFFATAWSVEYRPPHQRWMDAIVKNVPRVVLALVIVPIVVYTASFVRFYADNAAGSITRDPLGTLTEFVKMQANTARYHAGMRQEHPYQSTPKTWPFMSRPIAFWYNDYGNGIRGHILAVGNPVLWWTYLLCFPALVGLVLARRRWSDAFILAGYVGQYFPWFASSRTAFFYYMLPVVPFMALGVVAVAAALPGRVRQAVMWATGIAAVGAAALFYPIWTGIPIPEDVWGRLMLFRSWI